MTKAIDSVSISAEAAIAGLQGLPITWSADGPSFGSAVTSQQRATAQAVFDAHNAGKAMLRRYANARQWQLAIGGYTINFVGGPAVTFDTSPVGLTLIAGKVARLKEAEPPSTFNWQVSEDALVPITAAQMIKAGVKTADFVQATFDALPAIIAAINAGTITSEAQIDAASWPANTATV